jgi:2-polyprenyl-3-methyl-5-hydroxy-6-metoxy-1,4-benzoquinol methylase
MIAVTSCPVCGNAQFEKFLSCTDYTVSKKEFALVRCRSCALVITSPRPATETLGEYYQSADYISHTSKANSLIDSLYLLVRNYTLKGKTALSKSLQPKKGKVLDYGCGTGNYLHACMLDGWQTEGVEPNDTARLLAQQKGLTVANRLQTAGTNFDLITLWHVLEHVPDLTETVALLYQKLKAGGSLVIAVPNHQSLDGSTYAEHWAGYDVPRHLWHFNRQNMEQLLLNHGFTLKTCKPMLFDSFYVSLLSETYKGKGITKFFSAFITGLRSNFAARKTKEYSSLIYIAGK